MRKLAPLLAALALACASGPAPRADGPIPWEAADAQWSILIVTQDADGDERVTRIWLALEGGVGTLRTGDSRWWANLKRDPSCALRIDGSDHPLRAEFVDARDARARIDEAFLAKYGWWERVMFPQERGETHDNYARLVATP